MEGGRSGGDGGVDGGAVINGGGEAYFDSVPCEWDVAFLDSKAILPSWSCTLPMLWAIKRSTDSWVSPSKSRCSHES